MARITIVVAGLLAGAYLFLPPRHIPADEKPVPATGGDFAKKFVVVNYKTGGDLRSSLLQDAGVRRLGGREFLVGEFCGKDARGSEWQGTVLWIPVESIDTLMVFADKAKALAFTDTALEGQEKK